MTATGYSLSAYGSMITCEPRMGAYAEALRRSITPGCRVIDLGAGPGLFALLACKYGAGHVIAIEPNASIDIARKAAAENGFSDRITFVRDLSTQWHSTEKADVVVSDIRGVLPLFENHIPTITDVRARLLKPDGVLIPGVDRIYAALVEAPKLYETITKPWLDAPYGVDLSAGKPFVANAWRRVAASPETMLTEPQPFVTLDYRSIIETNHRTLMSFPVQRAGTVHGILMWFEAELAPGIGFSNAPGAPEQIYGQAFFPLEHPVRVAAGAIPRVDVSAHLLDGQYIWSWAFQGKDAEGNPHAFQQSCFRNQILSPHELAPRASTFCPPDRIEQKIDAQILAWFDGQTDLKTLAARLNDRFPDFFRDPRSAFNHVAAMSARYNKK